MVTGPSYSSDRSAICRAVDVPAMRVVIRRPAVQHQPSSVLHVWTTRRTVHCHVRHEARIQRPLGHLQTLERHRTVRHTIPFGGVASYGALGHVPPPSTPSPSISWCLIFQVTSKPHKLCIIIIIIIYLPKFKYTTARKTQLARHHFQKSSR